MTHTSSSASDDAPEPAWQPQPVLGLLLQDLFVLAMFSSLLLIGADRIAIIAGGLTLRLVFPLLMLTFGFLFMQRGGAIAFDKTLSLLFLLLAIAGALSVIHSYDVVKSIGYTIWVLFDFFLIIALSYNFAKHYPPVQVLKIWFLVYRIHVVALLAEVAWNVSHGALGRPHLWFYESSYLAIFMSGYFGSALYMFLSRGRQCAPDFALSLVGMLATTSATGMFGMVFAVLLNFIVARQRIRLLIGSAVIASAFFGMLFLMFRDTIYYRLVADVFLQPGISSEIILTRAGNRWIRAAVGWEAFLSHPWFGVGIGGDVAYMQAEGVSDYARQFVKVTSDVENGQPFSNINVEVLGTMGMAGFLPFAAILMYAAGTMIRLIRRKHELAPVAIAFFIGFFSIFLALQFESTFLRYYLWSPLGLALGVMAQMRATTGVNGALPPLWQAAAARD
ncbi:MAG TPA: O-antigen ligase family protein [Rhizomicrobium sp.]|jgi:O-antigen ligase|nr:O-antigen ligase family protein [Rhizomicrobium sp.]